LRKRELIDARHEGAFQPSSELFPGNSLFSDVEAHLMHEVVATLIYWPVSIALGCWLFFEIAKRM